MLKLILLVGLLLVFSPPALAVPAAAVNLAPGTYGLRTLGRLNCGDNHGFWSVKPCGGLNTVDEWKVDDGSGRQQWKLAPHSSGKGVTIQVRVRVCLCIQQLVPTRSMTHMKHMCAPRSLSAEPPKQTHVPPSSPHPPRARTLRWHWALFPQRPGM